ncbi:MAG: PEP-CTERM sorting domain-containing protein [Nitrospira sp. CR1.2]|nr:PEP-CTERM sorting domain-containing protein [Nitrospira sp. CR1.2]
MRLLYVHWPVALCLLTHLLVSHVGDALAVQIAPNPNPDGNTITITPSTPRENLVPFTNVGVINIQPSASLSNQSRFENFGGGFLGGWVINSGTITNSDVFINNRMFTMQEGSQFNNLASGRYSGGLGSIGIAGTFVNEGAVDHILGHISVSESGQYIQRQGTGSSVTPTTSTPDAPFRNAGRVHIAAGDFLIDPLRLRAASATYDQSSTGTTQIDARFHSIGGTVWNAGAITIGATGEYRHESPSVPFLAGSTRNSGTFTNAGTTNIATGVFTNQGSVANSGTFTVGTAGQYVQEVSPGGSPHPGTQNSGTFTNAGRVRIGEGTSFGSFSNRTPPVAQYIQQAGGTTHIDGTFQVGGAKVENAGSMTVGSTGAYHQTFNKFVPVVSTTVNSGTFANAGSTVIDAGTFTNHGTVTNSGTWQIAPNGTGTFVNHGSTVNTGTFEVAAAGQVTGTGSYVQNAAAAQTIVNGTFAHTIALQAGVLSGVGTVSGTVTNTGGVIQPGTFAQSSVLTLANYVQGPSGRLDLKLGGLLAGSQYDVLRLTGSGIFGGSLSLRLINGFTPGLGHRFDLLTCSLGCSGANGGSLFSGGVSLPSLTSGLAWTGELTNGGTGFSYTVVAAAASAPEPGTLVLVGSGVIGLVGWGRRRGRRLSQ